MARAQTYSVWAALDPTGRAEIVNTINHRTFAVINTMFDDHEKVRWLVVTIVDQPGLWLIDLWQTKSTQNLPYVKPMVLTEHWFDTVDQAVGFAALNLVS